VHAGVIRASSCLGAQQARPDLWDDPVAKPCSAALPQSPARRPGRSTNTSARLPAATPTPPATPTPRGTHPRRGASGCLLGRVPGRFDVARHPRTARPVTSRAIPRRAPLDAAEPVLSGLTASTGARAEPLTWDRGGAGPRATTLSGRSIQPQCITMHLDEFNVK
jgi:hypothetical protein